METLVANMLFLVFCSIVDPIDAIYEIVREMVANSATKSAKRSEVLQRVIHKGYTEQHLNDCLKEFAELEVFVIGDDGETIRLY
jgi:DNA replication licensing factor MCM7